MVNETATPLWYVVHTYSGYENKVKSSLEKAIENRGMQDKFFDIQIPMEKILEVDGDKQKEVEDKIFPSYVLVKMIMCDQSWHVVRNIRGVTGFVGPGSAPVPLSDAEVAALGVETGVTVANGPAEVRLSFEVGDTVKITDDLLAGQTATVESIADDKKTATITVLMFGRPTSMEIETDKIRKID